MSLSENLTWRGLIKDKTFADNKWLDMPQTFYHGVDASSDSMTIGNLAAMMLARRLIDAGWKAVILAGGATSLIGDPGGKSSERELKPREEIQKNVEAIKQQINKLFAGKDFVPVDNYDWFKDIGYLEFLRDVGKNFSMAELMQRDFITERMGEGASGISYAEFSYSLIQGYDFWHLNKNHGVVLQIGASDQWGNMLSGVSLIRKKEGAEVNAFSMPLVIDKTTGKKFGKSEGGAIWLDPVKTTPTQFYQFWINTDDADVGDYLKYYSLKPKGEIEQVMSAQKADPASRVAQKALAEELTHMVHGSQDNTAATTVTRYLTSQVSIGEASAEDLAAIRQELSSVKVESGSPIIATLVEAGLASSNSDARRLLASGSIYINGKPINDTKNNLSEADFLNGRLLLRRGKAYKDSALVELK
ncbi:tyrosine--tRNA ligase [Candidatus Saccharibacteria bacterium CG10_big_fil_rev_8_21_14_0_10_47_8]|nr:MAG: tyrosine--tRNA ligase [Candidatus Saccharibacteria bacterium CG10_big_fil_rev_8_21_14_0_10_47_8]